MPMALLIGIWGSDNRVYAAIKFFLYTLAGSLLMLVGDHRALSATAADRHARHSTCCSWQAGGYSPAIFQIWVFLAFFGAFAVKVPMFPFHTWLPDAHVQAPTAGSIILAGVLLKMGGYGFIRFALPLVPRGPPRLAAADDRRSR